MTQASVNRPKLSGDAFGCISRMAYQEAGLDLPVAKKAFVYSRLQKRLRILGLPSFESYCDLLKEGTRAGKVERVFLISALTTNVTQFFREPHHFEMLVKNLIPALEKRVLSGNKVRIWSAGCSSGMEPFSIALACLKNSPALSRSDFRILATDIDPEILTIAQNAEYPVSSIPDDWRAYFEGNIEKINQDMFRFRPAVRELVAFRRLNLISEWPFSGKFDAIFCRNVAIYFDENTQKDLFGRLSRQLQEHGFLYVGHSERAPIGAKPGLVSCGLTTYRLAENT